MGPPPHNWVLEQLMDIAAREMEIDPVEIRRRNFVRPEQFPYTLPSGNEYDSGNYAAAMDKLLEMGGYDELRAEQERARAEGRLVGIGVVSTVEPGVFDWGAYAIVGNRGTGVPEGATVGIDVWGKITARVGFAAEGQGQYTLISQLLADYFGVDIADVQVVSQDTLNAPPHFGPGGSRLGVAITGAVLGAAGLVKDKLIKVAARLLGAEAGGRRADGRQAAREGCAGARADGRAGRGDDADARRPAAAGRRAQSRGDVRVDGARPDVGGRAGAREGLPDRGERGASGDGRDRSRDRAGRGAEVLHRR